MNYRMKAALRAAGYDLLDTLKAWAITAAIAAAVFLVILGGVLLVAKFGAGALFIIFALIVATITATYSGVEAYKRGY